MSIILKSFCNFILQITLLLAILFLLRGHNHPGGGFIGALIFLTGIGCYILTYKQPPRYISQKKLHFIILGLVCLFLSMVTGLFYQKNLSAGVWKNISILKNVTKIGTPLLLDTGIFLIISGSFIWVLALLEDEKDD